MAYLSLAAALQIATTNSTNTVTTGSAPGSFLILVLEIIVFLAGTLIVGTLLGMFVRAIALRAGASKAVASSIRQWTFVLMTAIGIIGVAYLTGVSSVITTLTISGLGGLIIGLALQNTISNVISGVFLLNDGIIRLGDDIQYGGPGGVRGVVVKLSLRSTWIRTSDGVITVIGNSNLSAGPILNYSGTARLERKMRV